MVRCDIFCRVIDNLGDAGVCWRLARQLVAEHGWRVRLWIDDVLPLTLLRPGLVLGLVEQESEGVVVCQWPRVIGECTPADVVIEAFACELPAEYLAAMARREHPLVWINLEYLSAEAWISGCHAKPSPHPALPLTKYFFFPGFAAGTGGLIKEASLPPPESKLLAATGELKINLFCYENPALSALLSVWSAGNEPIQCRVMEGMPRQLVANWLDEAFPVGSAVARGALRLQALPFVPQCDFDALLNDADLNFVRGEDSFVRAQWAERPFVWQAYPQADNAHLDKLDAFLALYLRHASDVTRATTTEFWRAWNSPGSIAEVWARFRCLLPELYAHNQNWANSLAQAGKLAENLVRFCMDRL